MRHRDKVVGRAAAVAVAFAFAATLGYAAGEPEALDDRLAVVATTNIVGDIVSQIGGDRISLYVMLPLGADPHVFRATPRDARHVADAAVVFINGAGLETDFLGDLIASVEPRRVVDLSEHLDLRRLTAGEEGHDEEEEEGEHHEEDEEEEEEHHDEEDEEEEGEHHEEEGDDEDGHHGEEEGHAHGEFDAHVWMDPTLVAAWTVEIVAVLAEVDPDGADEYERRAAALAADLDDLDAWVREQVAAIPRDRRILITDHDMFGYFADRYGFMALDSVIPGFSTAAEPSARHLAGLREAIDEHAVPAIFVGATVSSQAAQAVAGDLGIDVVAVYTGSLSEPGGPAATYQDFIRINVERIVAALGRR